MSIASAGFFILLASFAVWRKKLFLAKRGRRPRVAGFIILSLKGLRRDEISCGVYGHVYLFLYLFVRLVYAGNDVTRPRARGLMV